MLFFDTAGNHIKGVDVRQNGYFYYSAMQCDLNEIPRGKYTPPLSEETYKAIGAALCKDDWKRIHR